MNLQRRFLSRQYRRPCHEQAIYVAIDVFRNRQREKEAHANPLRKQYYEKRDDSDKLKLDSVEEDL